jgi:hypothetical protein
VAMLNWEGWAANFLGWGSTGEATPTPVVTPAVGGGSRRRRLEPVTVTYKGQEHYFRTEHEAEEFVESLRAKAQVAPPTKKQAKKAKRAPQKPAEPAKVELRAPQDMSHLQALVDAHNAQMAAKHHADMLLWKQRESMIEQDDAEIFALLRMLGDDV